MVKLKGCPKCHGDIFMDYDRFGWYEQCLQCGYIRDLVYLQDTNTLHNVTTKVEECKVQPVHIKV